METHVTTLYNREHKDRLFKFIFGKDTEQSKRWRLQLYNALNGTNYTDPDALKINTIENVIFITMHNDISFLVDTDMNLYEEQSSWKLHLSDAFYDKESNNGDFEWTATVINLHPDHNSPLNKNCTPLYHYVKYISMITANRKAGMERHEAIEKAVDQAIKENLLEGFFKINKAEVIGMCLTEYDEEEFKRVCREDGYTDGLTDGRSEKAIEDARSFYSNGVSIEIIAKSLNMSIEEVENIIKEPVVQ